jgi:hypothetical protein
MKSRLLENLYSYEQENLEEMNEFLDAHDQPKLNQHNINHLNRSVPSNKTEAVIVSQQRRDQDQMGSKLNSTRPLKYNKCQCSLNYSMK